MAKSSLITVRMEQVSQVNWRILAPKGYVLMDNITVASNSAAEEYAKDYISSFRNWVFELVPLKEKK